MKPSRHRPPPAHRAWTTALALILLLFAAALGIVRHLPPAPVAETAQADVFSAGRAARDIAAMAQAPHPVGSAEHARVREFVVERMRALGLAPEVQQGIGVNRKAGVAAPVANILARIGGRGGNGRAILLVAHYDSVPTGPGASDDAAGVAALLEAARWLGTQPALRNDVILLASDGEEFGLLGAEAFVAGHRWARDVALVVNLEARGHTGPVILFETSAGNAALIDGAGRGAPEAVANSLTYEVYKRLPHDTDFSVFKRAGIAGVNLAPVGGVTHYHSALDTPANVAPATLQHNGTYLTGLLQAFGNADLPLPDRKDAIYFPAPWGGIVQYDPRLALPLAGLGMLLVAGLGWRARRAGTLDAGATGLALLRVLALLAGAALAGWVFWAGARWANPDFHWLSNGDGYHTDLLLDGLLLLVAASVAALAGQRPADRFACWFVWALLAAAVAGLLPGASWLLAWPLLAGVLGQYAADWSAPQNAARRQRPGPAPEPALLPTLWLALGLTPLAYLGAPMIWLLSSALGPALLPAVLLLGALFLLPLAPLLGALPGRTLHLLLLAAGCGLIGAGVMLGGFNAEARKPNHVAYLLERTPAAVPPARARWVSTDEYTDNWTAQFLGTSPVSEPLPELGSTRPMLQAEAPVLGLPVPQIRITADEHADGLRRITLHVESPADVLTLRARGDSAVRRVEIDGTPLFVSDDGQPFRRTQVVAPPAAGVDLRFDLPPGTPLTLEVLQQFWGLPATTAKPRGIDMMPTPGRQADSRFTLDRWTE